MELASSFPKIFEQLDALALPSRPPIGPISPGSEEREIARLRDRIRALQRTPDESSGELSGETFRLAKKARRHGIKIEVETPVKWLNGRNGGLVCRQMYGELVTQLGRLGLPFKARPITKNKSLEPRAMKEKQLLLSYHSAGEGDHIWRIKESYLPPFFSWDRHGFSGWSSLARSKSVFNVCLDIDQSFANGFAEALRERVLRERITKYRQPGDYNMPTEHPYVFYAMQVPGDLVMTHGRLDQRALLQALVQVAEDERSLLVIKRHPLDSCEQTASALAEAEKSPYVRISQAHVHDLIHGAQSVVVTNSGVGMEAVLQHKPVFTFGASDYRWATYEASVVEQLSSAFKGPLPKLTVDQLNRFITLYFGAHCIDATNAKSIEASLAAALREWLIHSA